MSAEIIPFVPRPRRERWFDESVVVLRAVRRVDDLTMDHADTSPCECVPSECVVIDCVPWEMSDGAEEPA